MPRLLVPRATRADRNIIVQKIPPSHDPRLTIGTCCARICTHVTRLSARVRDACEHTRRAHARGPSRARARARSQAGIKWVAKIGSRLFYRPLPLGPSLPTRPLSLSLSSSLRPPSLPPPQWMGARSEERRTIKRNDAVKEQDEH